MARCGKCGEAMRYNPSGSYELADGHSMGNGLKHAVDSFRGGHPGIAAVHAAARVAKVAHREIQARRLPYECPRCGHRTK